MTSHVTAHLPMAIHVIEDDERQEEEDDDTPPLDKYAAGLVSQIIHEVAYMNEKRLTKEADFAVALTLYGGAAFNTLCNEVDLFGPLTAAEEMQCLRTIMRTVAKAMLQLPGGCVKYLNSVSQQPLQFHTHTPPLLGY